MMVEVHEVEVGGGYDEEAVLGGFHEEAAAVGFYEEVAVVGFYEEEEAEAVVGLYGVVKEKKVGS